MNVSPTRRFLTESSHVDFETRLTCSKAVKNAVLAQDWVAVGADQHAGLRVPEDVVFLQQTCRGEELQLQSRRQNEATGYKMAFKYLCLR